MRLKTLDNLVRRLKKIGIEIKLGGNYPWLYLEYINGKRVFETFASEHGFVIGYLGKNDFDFAYAKETFNLLRKYRARRYLE